AAVAQLAADLARRVDGGMHVGIRGAGANRAQQLVELARGDALPGDGEDLVRTNGPGDRPFLRTRRRDASHGSRSRHRRGLAEPDHDAAYRVPLAEVDVRLLDRALETAIAERVVDDSASIVDVGPEAAARDARDRAPQGGRDDRGSGGVAGYEVHFV